VPWLSFSSILNNIIYRLTLVSSSKVLDLGMLSDLSMLPLQWGRCFSFGPLTLAAAIAAPLAVAAFSFTSSCSSLAFLYGKLFGGAVTEEPEIPAIEGVLTPKLGLSRLSCFPTNPNFLRDQPVLLAHHQRN